MSRVVSDMWTLVGNEHAVDLLERALAGGRLPHAILIAGPAGSGKTHLALELAKALNCEGEMAPCGRCIPCRQIAAGAHPDVTVLQRPDGKDSIQIAPVRELRENASLRPFQGRRKVFIVAGAEALTLPAADALLKTLEEPQAQGTLVLTAPDVDSVPETVVSRCRIVQLQPVPAGQIAAALRARGLDEVQAERVAHLALGSVGWAIDALKRPKLLQQREDLLRSLLDVLDLDLDGRLTLAETLAAERKDRTSVRRAIELLLVLARDALLLAAGREPAVVTGEQRAVLQRQAERRNVAVFAAYIQALRTAMERIDRNVDPRLTLEALLVAAP